MSKVQLLAKSWQNSLHREIKMPKKVQKSTDFFAKSVLLVVAGEGFEPTTSGL